MNQIKMLYPNNFEDLLQRFMFFVFANSNEDEVAKFFDDPSTRIHSTADKNFMVKIQGMPLCFDEAYDLSDHPNYAKQQK